MEAESDGAATPSSPYRLHLPHCPLWFTSPGNDRSTCKSLFGDGSALSVHMFIGTHPHFNSLLVFTTQIMENGPNKLQSLFIQTLTMSLRSTVINRFPSDWVATRAASWCVMVSSVLRRQHGNHGRYPTPEGFCGLGSIMQRELPVTYQCEASW